MQDNSLYERYQRQVILGEFGEAGQKKLLQSKVLVIGAGGLGCPVLQYLTAAGVGTISIVDDDTVALSNLHRQVLYSVNDIGFSKAETAANVLGQLNPDISIIAYNERLTTQNALGIISDYDIVIDGTDNFATRYLVNDGCVLCDKPLVYGAISQFEGQVAVFNYPKNKNDKAVNYRDLFPEPPKEGEVLNCAEAGVLGVLPGIIGMMMANETIKMITGIGEPLIDQLLTYNTLNNQVYILNLSPREETRSLVPGNEKSFMQTDYEWLCSVGSGNAAALQFEIGMEDFNVLLQSGDITVIDVREPGEAPPVDEFTTEKIPLSQLKEKLATIREDKVVFFCQAGQRSLQAAQWLFDTFGGAKEIYSLRGGILQWKKQQANQTI